MVEFALVAPILFLLLFSVIQMGLLFGAQNGLVNGVRETARRAATYRVAATTFQDGTLTDSICQAVRDELEAQLSRAMPGFDWNRLDAQATYEYTQNPDGSTWFLTADINVTAYRHPLYVPLVSWFFDGTDGVGDGNLALPAREQMRIENPPQTLTSASEACPAW